MTVTRQGLSLTSHATYIHLAGVHDHSTSMEEWLGDYQLTQELMTIVHPEPRSYSDCASSRQPPTDRSVATHVTPTPRHAQITQRGTAGDASLASRATRPDLAGNLPPEFT